MSSRFDLAILVRLAAVVTLGAVAGCNSGGAAGGGSSSGGTSSAGTLYRGEVNVENECGCNAAGATSCVLTESARVSVDGDQVTVTTNSRTVTGTIDQAGNYSVTVLSDCDEPFEVRGTLNTEATPSTLTVEWDDVLCGCLERVQGTLTAS